MKVKKGPCLLGTPTEVIRAEMLAQICFKTGKREPSGPRSVSPGLSGGTWGSLYKALYCYMWNFLIQSLKTKITLTPWLDQKKAELGMSNLPLLPGGVANTKGSHAKEQAGDRSTYRRTEGCRRTLLSPHRAQTSPSPGSGLGGHRAARA